MQWRIIYDAKLHVYHIDSLNGSGIDENIPVFKIEIGLIEIFFPVNGSWMDEIKFSIQ